MSLASKLDSLVYEILCYVLDILLEEKPQDGSHNPVMGNNVSECEIRNASLTVQSFGTEAL